ncbi:MAG: NADP-dependent oxidoreductase [Pseudomonadota bacterium]
MTDMNRRVVLQQRPSGAPRNADFAVLEVPLEDLGPDSVTVRVDTLSVDAFIRTTLDEREGIHGVAPLGGPVVALGVGQVSASTSEALREGDWVSGPLMAQTHAQLPAGMLQKIEPGEIIPPRTFLGVLGMTTGLTAWVGMVEIAGVQAGDTVVVSGAAGAVGSVAGQIAKARGARVIGIAGGPHKVAYLTDTLGLDAGIDYKQEDPAERIKALAPHGVDVYFDNVGGELLDTVLDNLAVGGRVSLCGAISQYEHLDDVRGPKLYLRLAERNATMRGFTVDHYPQRFAQAAQELSGLMVDGRLVLPEHVMEGIDQFPEALITLLNGGHMGKMLVVP